MSQSADAWYVRLPDGRVIRAKSTLAVRHHLESGTIPLESHVRRSPDDDWLILAWTPEFADLVSPGGESGAAPSAARRGAAVLAESAGRGLGVELRTVGVPGMVADLLTALDSALMRHKLLVPAVVGPVVALLFWFGWQGPAEWGQNLSWVPKVVTGLGCLVLGGLCIVLLTQMTFVELSRLRVPRWREVTSGLAGRTLRLMVCYLLVGGGFWLIVLGLRQLPPLLHDPADGVRPWWLGIVTVLTLVLEVGMWPMLGMTLLLGPVVVIEEGSFIKAIGQWLRTVNEHLSRLLLYEALAIALGSFTTLPFLFPVLLAGWSAIGDPRQAETITATLWLLGAIALTPLVTYLIVANVYIYLNVRYEFSPASR